jgi:hypothetical protein
MNGARERNWPSPICRLFRREVPTQSSPLQFNWQWAMELGVGAVRVHLKFSAFTLFFCNRVRSGIRIEGMEESLCGMILGWK